MIEKIKEYDIVRIIAVILVVISHCTYYQIITNYGGINYSAPDVLNITFIDEMTRKLLTFFKNILYIFHMPLFFALSGALFKNSINRGKVNNLKELIIQKTKRLLIPFIVITIIFATPIKYLTGYFSNSQNILKDIFIGQVLIQGNTYLWFLPTLFFEFLIIWLIKQRTKDDKKQKIIIFLVLSALNFLSSLIKIVIIKNVLYYLVYFYIGYCFEESRIRINNNIDKKSNINIWGSVALIMLALITFNIYNFGENLYAKILKHILTLVMGILGSYMIYLISYKLSKTCISENSKFQKIGEYSFGIYLYSDPLNYLILYIIYNICGINTFYTNPGIILIFIVRLGITLFVSFTITGFLRKKKIKYIS